MSDTEDDIEYDDGFDADDIVIDDYDDDTFDEPDAGDDTDDYEDATDDEIDFVVALYREDGEPQVSEMALPLANDLDELTTQLRRLPADAGACAFVSISGEFFVVVRVRGKNVQVLLNDSVAANDWPIARDVLDVLGIEVPEEDDDSEVVGDLDILADQGVSDLDMEAIAGDYDEDSGDLVRQIVDQLKVRKQFDAATRDR